MWLVVCVGRPASTLSFLWEILTAASICGSNDLPYASCKYQACWGCLPKLAAVWHLFRHDHIVCAGSLWYASAVALASVGKMYRANEDGRALPVLLLAPVAASGEPLIPLCPAL